MPATLCYTGKLVSVIKSKLSWLDMSVCKLDCNEDIFVTLYYNYDYLPLLNFIYYFEQHPYNTQWCICSTPVGVLEVHKMFYYSGRGEGGGDPGGPNTPFYSDWICGKKALSSIRYYNSCKKL